MVIILIHILQVLQNLMDNIQDQDQKETVVESASFLDLTSTMDIEERINKMKVTYYDRFMVSFFKLSEK